MGPIQMCCCCCLFLTGWLVLQLYAMPESIISFHSRWMRRSVSDFLLLLLKEEETAAVFWRFWKAIFFLFFGLDFVFGFLLAVFGFAFVVSSSIPPARKPIVVFVMSVP